MAYWMRCVQSGENYECEYRLRGRDGQYRWFRARAVPLRDQAGKVLRWYGTCADIHDSKLLEHSMRDSAVELERMVDERTAALRLLSSRLMTMQDDERRRIARELHDGLGQELVAIKMLLNGILHDSPRLAKRVAEVNDMIDGAAQQIRSLSHLLHPPLLDEMGLESALNWYAQGFGKRSGVDVEVSVAPDIGRLGVEAETAIFRIVQECLTNVHRHSGSTKASIQLTRSSGLITLEVCDQGKGMNPHHRNGEGSPGVGLAGMRERVRQLRGHLDISSHEGRGTTVVATMPDTIEGNQSR